MIDIPLGKALVPVEENIDAECFNCALYSSKEKICVGDLLQSKIACTDKEREDGKNVIFKLVDYPVEDENV